MNATIKRPSEQVLDAARDIAAHLSIQQGKLSMKEAFKLLIPHLVKFESDVADGLKLENSIMLEEWINGHGRN